MFKKILTVALIVLLAGGAALAKSGADISVVAAGARSVAMGRAGVAVKGDTNNSFVNPASLASTQQYELTSMSTQLMSLVDYKFVSGNVKTPKGTLGVSYVGASTPGGFYASADGTMGNPINYGSSVVALSYANDISAFGSDMSVGTNVKYFQNGFSGAATGSGRGYSADLALLVEATPTVTWGINYQNLLSGGMNWGTGTKEDLASGVKVGGAFKLLNDKVLLATDADLGQGPMLLHGGIEWRPIQILALRGGLDQAASGQSSAATNLTAGVGLNLRGVQVDLAYRQDSIISDNSNFYLSLSYVPQEAKITVQVEKKDVMEMVMETKKTDGLESLYGGKTVVKASSNNLLDYYK